MIKKIVLLILLSSVSYGADNGHPDLSSLSAAHLDLKQSIDTESIVIYRRGLRSIMTYIKSDRAFSGVEGEKSGMIPAATREELKSIWKSICDYYLAIDSVDSYHRDYMSLEGDARSRSFNICRAAMLMEYSFALDFIHKVEGRPGLSVVLNDIVDGIGIPSGSYDSFKFRFLNVVMATEFAAFETVSGAYGKPDNEFLLRGSKEDSKRIWKYGTWRGEALTLKNGFDILKKSGSKTWFPVQKGISNFAGDLKVYRISSSLITERQIGEIAARMRPGDIILERREWYLSNIGIPGFWTHAAIYIGTPEEREAFFRGSDLSSLLSEGGVSSLEELLQKSNGGYGLSLAVDEKGDVPRVLEAVGEGVLFTTFEHSASCDSIAVLRPRLSKKEIAAALVRGFRYSGRPYDFDFDFLTDSSLVCTELVYKAYESYEGRKGIVFPLKKIMGRVILPANGIGELYASEAGRADRQLDFVLFYDGIEAKKKAVRSSDKSFIESIERPKWHLMVQQLQ